MAAIRIQEGASHRLDDIYRYTRDRWGEGQAEKYITRLFADFDKIAGHGVASKPIPAEFGVEGFFFRYERHFVYWRHLLNGDIGIQWDTIAGDASCPVCYSMSRTETLVSISRTLPVSQFDVSVELPVNSTV